MNQTIKLGSKEPIRLNYLKIMKTNMNIRFGKNRVHPIKHTKQKKWPIVISVTVPIVLNKSQTCCQITLTSFMRDNFFLI